MTNYRGVLMNTAVADRELQAHDLAGLIASTPENLLYLSGGLEPTGHVVSKYTTNVFAIVARAQYHAPVLVAGLGDVGQIRQVCPPGSRIVHYGSFTRYVNAEAELDEHELWVKHWVVDTPGRANVLDALVAGIEEAGLASSRIGYDERGMSTELVRSVTERLPGVELVPAFAVLRRIRLVKTPEEIDRVTRSLRLTEEAIQAALAIAKVGVEEEDLIREFRMTVVRGGAATLANEITFTRRAAVGGHAIQDGVLKEGDIIRFDVGCRADGYCSDIARLYAFRGDVDPRAQKIYDAMVAGEERAMAAMRPGVMAREIFHEAVEGVKAAGVGEYQRNHVGHAVGLEVYDGCLLSPGDETVLESGMTFEVETPYYEIGFLGIQIEDTVIVRDDGHEMITRLPRTIEPVG
jgi:Xaa-Pro dipeptidase